MITVDDLKLFCAEEATKYRIHEPHAYAYQGKVYSYGTDGHRMVLVEGHLEGLDLYPALKLDQFLIEPQGVPVNTAELKAFLECDKPTTAACEDCDGKGKVKHECDCDFCIVDRMVDCGCNGKRFRITNRGWIGKVLLNLALMADTMKTVADDTVLIYTTTPEDTVHIFATDRHVCVMPMRTDNSFKTAPRFKLNEAAK